MIATSSIRDNILQSSFGVTRRPKWVEIFWVDVHCAYPGVQATNSRFTLNSTRHTQVHIIDPLNNRLYMDFKNIHEIPHMNHMDRNCPIGMNANYQN
ncbi:hypothetical protein YC2023_089142 [Brassica napus]